MNFSQGHSGTKVRYVNRACFPEEKHQNSHKWAKLMNFSFWPFLWFGLPGRLLINVSLDGRNRTILIAESLARVIAAIRITGVAIARSPYRAPELRNPKNAF